MEKYIKPIDPENVAGTNVEYDEDFQKLQSLIQEKPEQQFGEFIAEAEGKDWSEIYNLSSDLLLNKSKDLLVMSYFTQSAIVRYGLAGFADGLKVIFENLNLYWDDVYPNLEDEDGDFDPDFRINALSLFTSHDGILKQLRNAFLIKDTMSHTDYSMKAVEGIIEGRADSEDYPGGLEKLGIDLQIAMEQDSKELIAIKNALHYLEQINELFENKIETTLKFDNIIQLLSRILNVMSATTTNSQSTVSSPEQLNTKTVTTSASSTQPINLASYQIHSRKDINLLLEKMHVYFEKNEPSHPAPLFIRRMQKMLNMNFYEIMKDISPESLDQLEILVGEPINNVKEDDEN